MKIKIGTNNKENVYIDFDKTHNIFVPGACGAGKSYLEHLMIKEISKQDKDAIFILIDPKHIEFYNYKNIQSCKVYTNKNYMAELRKIAKDKNYNNVYIFFDEYAENIFDFTCFNDKIHNLILKSKTRNIHTIVCSQKGGDEDVFNKSFIDFFDAKIILRVWNKEESRYLISNNKAAYLKGNGDAILVIDNKMCNFKISSNL